jgi:predicted kinase
MKELILLRGIPGSGKTTLANIISHNNVAADEYFEKFNDGEFDGSQLSDAHQWCHDQVEKMMSMSKSKIVVHNTFTEKWEMQDYFDLAEKHGYRVHTIVVENRHGGESNSNVPEHTIESMKGRFEICL